MTASDVLAVALLALVPVPFLILVWMGKRSADEIVWGPYGGKDAYYRRREESMRAYGLDMVKAAADRDRAEGPSGAGR